MDRLTLAYLIIAGSILIAGLLLLRIVAKRRRQRAAADRGNRIDIMRR